MVEKYCIDGEHMYSFIFPVEIHDISYHLDVNLYCQFLSNGKPTDKSAAGQTLILMYPTKNLSTKSAMNCNYILLIAFYFHSLILVNFYFPF